MITKSVHPEVLDNLTTLEKLAKKVEDMGNELSVKDKELSIKDEELSVKDEEIRELRKKLSDNDIEVD